MKSIKVRPLQRGLSNLYWVWMIVYACFGLAFFEMLTSSNPISSTTPEPQKAWVQIAALAVAAGMSIAKGIKQKKAAKELERKNVRPEYKISRGTLQNLAIAKEAANQGLSEQTYRNSLDQLQLGLSTNLRNNILYGRGNVNTNATMRAYNEGVSELNAADERAREKNRAVLMEANENLAREEQAILDAKTSQYNNTANLVAGLRSAGDENLFNAAGTALGAVAGGQVELPGTGAKLNAAGGQLPKMKLSEQAAGYGITSDYNKIIKTGLGKLQPTLQGGNDFWRNAGKFRS